MSHARARRGLFPPRARARRRQRRATVNRGSALTASGGGASGRKMVTRWSEARVGSPFAQQDSTGSGRRRSAGRSARARRCRCAAVDQPRRALRASIARVHASRTRSRRRSPAELLRVRAARLAQAPALGRIASATASRCLASAAASPGSNSRPASPTASGSAPRLAAMTGTPHVIASSTGMPNPSV